jgi:hypothetical protein
MLDKPVVLVVLYTSHPATYLKIVDVEEYDVQFESLRTTMKPMGNNQNKYNINNKKDAVQSMSKQ